MSGSSAAFNAWTGNLFDYKSITLEKQLDKPQLASLRRLAREKRSLWGNAPIGVHVFRLIREQAPNIHFVLEEFSHDDVDAILTVPYPDSDFTAIILNKRRPLANQVFAATHEYYHFLVDLPKVRIEPKYCDLTRVENISEIRASRFAAEFLFPSEALATDVERFEKNYSCAIKKADPMDIGFFAFELSLVYGIPFKAALMRLIEEEYVSIRLTDDEVVYQKLKKSQQAQVDRLPESLRQLLEPGNPYLDGKIEERLSLAYEKGLASYDEVMKDASYAGLDASLLPDKPLFNDDDEESSISEGAEKNA